MSPRPCRLRCQAGRMRRRQCQHRLPHVLAVRWCSCPKCLRRRRRRRSSVPRRRSSLPRQRSSVPRRRCLHSRECRQPGRLLRDQPRAVVMIPLLVVVWAEQVALRHPLPAHFAEGLFVAVPPAHPVVPLHHVYAALVLQVKTLAGHDRGVCVVICDHHVPLLVPGDCPPASVSHGCVKLLLSSKPTDKQTLSRPQDARILSNRI